MSLTSSNVSIPIAGQVVDSSALVPGDIVNLASPLLAVIPADLLLLSGDTIVNESMLTGESIPVSKAPIQDDDLVKWREGGDVTAAMAKGLLYAGTQVVRIRGNVVGGQALALVVRTGE